MNVSLQRAYSRLNSLFISFQGGAGAHSANTHQTTSFLNPSQFIVGGVVAGQTTHDEGTLQFDVQIGATKFPESPATSIPEIFSLLHMATHIYDESLRTLNITPQSNNNSFVIGVGLQTSSAAFSGYNTRSGDLLTVRAKNLATDAAVNAPARVYVTMVHEKICEIREGSVAILD